MPPKHPGRGGHGGGRGGHGGGAGEKRGGYSEGPGWNESHNQEAEKHESHHYMRQYGGKVLDAAMFGFGSQLGRDAANELTHDVTVCVNPLSLNGLVYSFAF